MECWKCMLLGACWTDGCFHWPIVNGHQSIAGLIQNLYFVYYFILSHIFSENCLQYLNVLTLAVKYFATPQNVVLHHYSIQSNVWDILSWDNCTSWCIRDSSVFRNIKLHTSRLPGLVSQCLYWQFDLSETIYERRQKSSATTAFSPVLTGEDSWKKHHVNMSTNQKCYFHYSGTSSFWF